MPLQDNEILYNYAVKWIKENPQVKSIPDEIKEDFFYFKTLPSEIAQLLLTLITLLKTTGLPQEIERSLP